MRILRQLAVATALVIAALQTLRIGWADYLYRKDTLEFVRHAARVWPSDADFYVRLADLDRVNAISHLRHAVLLDPLTSKSWIALGLRVEQQGNLAEAESCYLQAARADRQFLPAWTLANFYSRRNDEVRFWRWARNATQMSYESIRPLLRLASVFTDSGDVIMLQMIVPRPNVEREFLRYLIEENRDASAIAARILSRADKEDLSSLMAWINRLIETTRVPEARELWNALSDKRLIPYPHLTHLTNADFSQKPLDAAGFDWRITPPPGVDCERTGGGLRVQLAGKQPEAFELLSQYVDVTNGTYVLSFEYRTVDIRTTTNLRWWTTEAPLSEPLAAAEGWTRSSNVFKAGSLNRLSLQEQRARGTTRPEGIVYFRGLTLTSHD
jgi:tetratricopeptide (TPR) repeat protein